MWSARANQLLQSRRGSMGAAPPRRRVLVVEDQPFVADPVATELRRHGDVEVAWCRDAGGEVTCADVVNVDCPLREPVAFVLDVRSQVAGKLTVGETGVACAAVAGIPVVAACPARPRQADAPWAVARCDTEDAARFCRQLLDQPAAAAELHVQDLVRRVLRLRGEEVGEVRVELLRWPDAVTVVVHSETPPSAPACAAVDRAVRDACSGLVGNGQPLGLSFSSRQREPGS